MSESPKAARELGESTSTSSSALLVVLCTFPNQQTARSAGEKIIAEKLAACVSMIPRIESIYEWKGEIQEEEEVLAIFKVSSEKYDDFEAILSRLHPYDVPEIVALGSERVNQSYLDWVLSK